ncbi:hypothetical protein C8R43DRAFT_1156393 [Mycena crocata]|nr:hypothetical protein C8R43DRAFT_1156393 [Mycena crocata]
MLSRSTLTQTRLNSVNICFTGAVDTIELLAATLKIPFLDAISKTSRSLLMTAQAVKQNKAECAELMEQTLSLLYAVTSIHTKSPTGELPPGTLNQIGQFTETLHKIHTYIEAQQDKNQIRQFFRQGEMKTLLKACRMGLQEALEVFTVQNVNLLISIADIQAYDKDRHEEVLQLIESLSDDSTSDRGSSLNLDVYAPI